MYKIIISYNESSLCIDVKHNDTVCLMLIIVWDMLEIYKNKRNVGKICYS